LRISYNSQGLLVTPTRPGSTYYLNGVQSVGAEYELNSIPVPDTGRSQSIRLYTPTNNSISVERIMSNYTDETTRIPGPFLHYVFGANSLFPLATGPATYKAGYLPKTHGMAITGTTSDILEYDLELLYQHETDILKASEALSSLKFRRSLLSELSYNIQTRGYLTEGLRFASKNIEIGTGSYDKLAVYTGGFNAGKFIKTIRSHNFSNTKSVFPPELLEVIDNNTFVDGYEILGLTAASVSLGIDYSRQGDQGKWLGSTDSAESNMWAVAQIPFTIGCSFTFTARKSLDNAIKNRPNNFAESQIRLVFDCYNHNGTPGNHFIINLGKKNYLESISVSGGSTGGDLVQYTYNYVNSNNDFLTYFTNVANFTAVDQLSTEKY
jgi:hypothetical protein